MHMQNVSINLEIENLLLSLGVRDCLLYDHSQLRESEHISRPQEREYDSARQICKQDVKHLCKNGNVDHAHGSKRLHDPVTRQNLSFCDNEAT